MGLPALCRLSLVAVSEGYSLFVVVQAFGSSLSVAKVRANVMDDPGSLVPIPGVPPLRESAPEGKALDHGLGNWKSGPSSA